MKKSKIVFGSNSELRAFETIDRNLPDGWRLLANTPLALIVNVEKSELPDSQWNFFLKTSVGFVLADQNHEPALAIEFDGLGYGFSSAHFRTNSNAYLSCTNRDKVKGVASCWQYLTSGCCHSLSPHRRSENCAPNPSVRPHAIQS